MTFVRLPLRAAALFLVLSISGAAFAATFTVTSTADSGAGTLRDAITGANANGGPDLINFAIPGAGPHVISIATPLPDITEETLFNGTSQGGSSQNTLAVGNDAVMMIVIRPSVGSTATHALHFTETANNSIVRGLVIQGFAGGAAILLNGADAVRIVGNFLGTNAAGTAADANSIGVFALNGATDTIIGSALAADRNVISGNFGGGISVGNQPASITIHNNYIGTNAAGTAAIGNNGGIRLNTIDSANIGDETAGAGNLISGNSAGGILISGPGTTFIEGNLIGTNATNTAGIPNAVGVSAFQVGGSVPTFVRVGGPNNTFANTIAYNSGDGVAVLFNALASPQSVQVGANSIHSNGDLGIDLSDDGVTANDVGDGDSGPNSLQNYPVINSASFNSGTSNVTINGELHTAPGLYELRFYQSAACDGSGFGEGQVYLGSSSVVTDGSGDATFSVTFAGTAGGVVTATATSNATAGTSEFSACASVITAVTPSATIDDPSVTETNAGTTTLTYTVTLSVAPASNVTIDYTTADGTATQPSDYATASGTLTILAGNTTGTINVTVNGDPDVEPNETVLLNLSNPSGVTLSDTQGVGTIQNDDALPTVTITDVTLAEGNGGGTTAFTFTVTLSAPPVSTATVDYATADGTAVGSSDFTATSGTLTFNAGDQSESFTVNVGADAMFEGDETFGINFTNPSNLDLTDDDAVGTIQNDDAQPTVTINDPTVAETDSGTTSLTFTVTLSNPSQDPVSVFFNTSDGTAIAPGDYTAASGSFTVLSGQLTAQTSVQVNGDTNIESDETVLMNLTSATGATITDNLGTGTIQNDDGLTTPSITISDPTVTEGNAGTTLLTYVVTLSSASASSVSVDWSTADGTANAGSDYVTNSGTLTIPSGSTSGQIDVVVNGDPDIEPNETVLVNLTNPTNATIADPQGSGTIANDDGLATPGISISDVSQAEGSGGGFTLFNFTISLSQPSAFPVSVTATTADGTATSGVFSDYLFGTDVITIPSGNTSGTFTVVVNADMAIEGDETFFVNLTAPVNGSIVDPQATATIQNDDGLGTPSITISDVSQAEGNAGPTLFNFTITLSQPSASDVSVTATTADGTATVAGADYVFATSVVTIPSGSTTGTFTVTVNGDPAVEANETFFVNLTAPVNATIGDAQGLGTIGNDDVVGTTTLTIQKTGPATVPAGNNITYTIVVTNSGAINATNVTVTDPIPAGTTFVSATPTQGTCSGTTTVTCTLGTIAPSANATITLIVQAPSVPASLSNTATVTSDQISTAPNSSTAATTVTGRAEVAGIPTLSEWALLALIAALALVALKTRL